MNGDLVAFLRARLDEDELFAREAEQRRWFCEDNFIDDSNGGSLARFEIKADARHAAGWDPARVLAEVQAKRRIIDRALQWMAIRDGEWGCCHSADAIAAGLCPEENPSEDETLRAFALPYAGQDGWRTEWALGEEAPTL